MASGDEDGALTGARSGAGTDGGGGRAARPPRSKPSVVFDMPQLAEADKPLSAAEVDFFVEHGFLVKRGLLDRQAVAGALARVWEHVIETVPLQAGRLSPDDPATWRAPRFGPLPRAPRSGPFEGRAPVNYGGGALKLHDLGAAGYLLALLPNDAGVRAVAERLLGDLRPSQRLRGVYAIFPRRTPDDPARGDGLGPHTDRVCQQLNACAYLADVPPRGGGFTVYPGSHRIMFRAHAFEANFSPLPAFGDCLRRVVRDIAPFELAADAGDVIFWHGRTVHSAGVHAGAGIRWALFADFTHDRDVLSADEHRAAGQFEWYKDAKLFRDDAPVGDDMWRNWRLGREAGETAGGSLPGARG